MKSNYCLGITDGFDTEEFELYGMYGDDRDTISVDNLHQLTFFANMTEEEISQIKNCCNITPKLKIVNEYIDKVFNKIKKGFGESTANIITLELINANDDKNSLTLLEAQEILYKAVDSAHRWAKVHCSLISDFFEDDLETQHRKAHLFVSAIPIDARYVPLAAISKKNQKITYCNTYYVSTVSDFFQLMGIFTIKEDKPIRKCKICGKYFIPISKTDEIYCQNCRNISYDKKIKENEILSCYRKIYKTQNARKQRNSHRPNIADKFNIWKNYAITKRDECKNGKISLEEMEKAISGTEWITQEINQRKG